MTRTRAKEVQLIDIAGTIYVIDESADDVAQVARDEGLWHLLGGAYPLTLVEARQIAVAATTSNAPAKPSFMTWFRRRPM